MKTSAHGQLFSAPSVLLPTPDLLLESLIENVILYSGLVFPEYKYLIGR